MFKFLRRKECPHKWIWESITWEDVRAKILEMIEVTEKSK